MAETTVKMGQKVEIVPQLQSDVEAGLSHTDWTLVCHSGQMGYIPTHCISTSPNGVAGGPAQPQSTYINQVEAAMLLKNHKLPSGSYMLHFNKESPEKMQLSWKDQNREFRNTMIEVIVEETRVRVHLASDENKYFVDVLELINHYSKPLVDTAEQTDIFSPFLRTSLQPIPISPRYLCYRTAHECELGSEELIIQDKLVDYGSFGSLKSGYWHEIGSLQTFPTLRCLIRTLPDTVNRLPLFAYHHDSKRLSHSGLLPMLAISAQSQTMIIYAWQTWNSTTKIKCGSSTTTSRSPKFSNTMVAIRQFMFTSAGQQIELYTLLNVCYQVATTIRYLHGENCVHGALSVHNTFVYHVHYGIPLIQTLKYPLGVLDGAEVISSSTDIWQFGHFVEDLFFKDFTDLGVLPTAVPTVPTIPNDLANLIIDRCLINSSAARATIDECVELIQRLIMDI